MPIVGGDGGELVGVALSRVHGVQAQVLLLGRVLGEEEAKLVEGRRVGHRVLGYLKQGLLIIKKILDKTWRYNLSISFLVHYTQIKFQRNEII